MSAHAFLEPRLELSAVDSSSCSGSYASFFIQTTYWKHKLLQSEKTEASFHFS